MSSSAFLSTLSINNVAKCKGAVLRASQSVLLYAGYQVVEIRVSSCQCDVGYGNEHKVGQVLHSLGQC